MPNLEQLILTGNSLDMLPEGVFSSQNSSLRVLWLDGNGLVKMPLLEGLTKLEELYIYNNYIEELPTRSLAVPSLRIVNLLANEIRVVHDRAFEGLNISVL